MTTYLTITEARKHWIRRIREPTWEPTSYLRLPADEGIVGHVFDRAKQASLGMMTPQYVLLSDFDSARASWLPYDGYLDFDDDLGS